MPSHPCQYSEEILTGIESQRAPSKMSALATPIQPERFAEAILDLPLSNLHFKAAELRNSISHLVSSNSQLQSFAGEGDKDCVDAIRENEETMMRMEERILLLRREVERRGFQWGEDVDTDIRARVNGNKDGDVDAEDISRPTNGGERQPRSRGGTMGDE